MSQALTASITSEDDAGSNLCLDTHDSAGRAAALLVVGDLVSEPEGHAAASMVMRTPGGSSGSA